MAQRQSSNDAAFIQIIEDRLDTVNHTQESVQSTSEFLLHYRGEAKIIVSTWLNFLKQCDTDHAKKLSVFYVCNDVVQTCERKSASEMKKAFRIALKHAMVHLRHSDLSKKVFHVLDVWQHRKIFDPDYINELRQVLSSDDDPEASEIIESFSPQEVFTTLESIIKIQSDVEQQLQTIQSVKLDASKLDCLKQLKNRADGEQFCAEFETSYTALDQFVQLLRGQVAARERLVSVLSHSQLYYDTQLEEVQKVMPVFSKFASGVRSVKRVLADHLLTLPSPAATPPNEEDVPSPTGSDDDGPSDMDTEPEDLERRVGEIGYSTIINRVAIPVLQPPPGANVITMDLLSQGDSLVKRPRISTTPTRDETRPADPRLLQSPSQAVKVQTNFDGSGLNETSLSPFGQKNGVAPFGQGQQRFPIPEWMGGAPRAPAMRMPQRPQQRPQHFPQGNRPRQRMPQQHQPQQHQSQQHQPQQNNVQQNNIQPQQRPPLRNSPAMALPTGFRPSFVGVEASPQSQIPHMGARMNSPMPRFGGRMNSPRLNRPRAPMPQRFSGPGDFSNQPPPGRPQRPISGQW